MHNKHLLNGLIASLMLTTIFARAQPVWISTIQHYFSKPTQTALIATTAVAGASLLTTFVCAWNWWKSSKQVVLLDTANKKNGTQTDKRYQQTAPHILIRSKESLKKRIVQKDKQLKQYARKITQLEVRLISMDALLATAIAEREHECSPACEQVSLDLMKKAISAFGEEYEEFVASGADGVKLSSAGCELTAPPIGTGDQAL